MQKLLSACLLSCLLLTCCSRHYHPAGFSGTGYSEYQAGPSRFIICFQGNEFTSNDTVMKYALLRASEVTLDAGFSYFKVQKKEKFSKNEFPGIKLYISCYQEDPRYFDTINAKEYIKYNKI